MSDPANPTDQTLNLLNFYAQQWANETTAKAPISLRVNRYGQLYARPHSQKNTDETCCVSKIINWIIHFFRELFCTSVSGKTVDNVVRISLNTLTERFNQLSLDLSNQVALVLNEANEMQQTRLAQIKEIYSTFALRTLEIIPIIHAICKHRLHQGIEGMNEKSELYQHYAARFWAVQRTILYKSVLYRETIEQIIRPPSVGAHEISVNLERLNSIHSSDQPPAFSFTRLPSFVKMYNEYTSTTQSREHFVVECSTLIDPETNYYPSSSIYVEQSPNLMGLDLALNWSSQNPFSPDSSPFKPTTRSVASKDISASYTKTYDALVNYKSGTLLNRKFLNTSDSSELTEHPIAKAPSHNRFNTREIIPRKLDFSTITESPMTQELQIDDLA